MKKIRITLHGQPARMVSIIRSGVMLPAAAILLSACVTINIYFPAAAVEKAADKIIDEVWQLQRKASDSPNKAAAPDAGSVKEAK